MKSLLLPLLLIHASSSSGTTGKNWNDFYLKVKEFFCIGGDGTINEVANGFFTFHEQRGIEEERPENNNKQKKLVKHAHCAFTV